jgi:F0F1-type ATP synthase membrane subunit b/b'
MNTNEQTVDKLYPELSQAAEDEAEKVIEAFKQQMKKAGDEAIETLWCNLIHHIESDSWSNFRTSIINGLSDYNNLNSEQDKSAIRKAVLKNHRDEIISDLNQDNLKQIEDLKQQIVESYRRH